MTIYDEYFGYCKTWNQVYGEKTYVLMEVGSFFEIYGLIDDNGIYTMNDMNALEKMTSLTIGVKDKVTYDGKKVS